MKYLIYILSLILLPNSLCDSTFSSLLIDDPDFLLINKFPEYLKLINYTHIIISEDLQLCINKSDHISEEMKGSLSKKEVISLDSNLYYYPLFNNTQEHINARIKYCVLNNAFEPCPCNDTVIDVPIIAPVQSNKCLNNNDPYSLKAKQDTLQEVVLRRLAMNNDENCQKCNGKNLTECIISNLPENYWAIDDLQNYQVYSDDWKSLIQTIISDDSLKITECLTESLCSPLFE